MDNKKYIKDLLLVHTKLEELINTYGYQLIQKALLADEFPDLTISQIDNLFQDYLKADINFYNDIIYDIYNNQKQ